MKQGKWILLVEDEYLEVMDMAEALRSEFPHLRVEAVCTESEFRASLDRLAADPPMVVIIDMMLPWQTPVPDDERIPAPPEVAEEGAVRAGLRCQNMMAKRFETRNIPVILYSHLTEKTLSEHLGVLPDKVTYLGKNNEYEELIALLRWRFYN